jgi:hypothetical protein
MIGIKKTRACSSWLEARGARTTIIERVFGDASKAHAGEPPIALAGFDSLLPRMSLEEHGFKYIVDAGVGNHLGNFDEILVHTFPSEARTAKATFSTATPTVAAPRLDRSLLDEFSKDATCGMIIDELSKTSASSSFVGACTAALAVGDILRGLHGGDRVEVLHWKLRGTSEPSLAGVKASHLTVLASLGYYDL